MRRGDGSIELNALGWSFRRKRGQQAVNLGNAEEGRYAAMRYKDGMRDGMRD
jgi:hypothetical protein